jgi:hypothetical protein
MASASRGLGASWQPPPDQGAVNGKSFVAEAVFIPDCDASLSVALHQIVADALILPAGDSGKKKNDKQAASTSAS